MLTQDILHVPVDFKMMVKREFELSDKGMENLGLLCLDIAKRTLSDPKKCEEYLRTVQECIAYLDYDGDYVVRP